MQMPLAGQMISSRNGDSLPVRLVQRCVFFLSFSLSCMLTMAFPVAIGGAPLVTIGLFIFAWTIYPNVHWIGPVIGAGVFGAG